MPEVGQSDATVGEGGAGAVAEAEAMSGESAIGRTTVGEAAVGGRSVQSLLLLLLLNLLLLLSKILLLLLLNVVFPAGRESLPPHRRESLPPHGRESLPPHGGRESLPPHRLLPGAKAKHSSNLRDVTAAGHMRDADVGVAHLDTFAGIGTAVELAHGMGGGVHPLLLHLHGGAAGGARQ